MRQLVAVVFIVALSPAASSGARVISPCELLSPSQVAPLLGTSIARVEPALKFGNGPSSRLLLASCTWTGPPTSDDGRGPSVTLALHAESRASFMSASAREPGTARATGAGGVAYWHLDHHAFAAWSHGWAVQLAGGLVSVYRERARVDAAAVLRGL